MCSYFSKSEKISFCFPWNMQHKKLFILKWISLTPWRLTQVIENVSFRRLFIIFYWSCNQGRFFSRSEVTKYKLTEEHSKMLQTEEQVLQQTIAYSIHIFSKRIRWPLSCKTISLILWLKTYTWFFLLHKICCILQSDM